MSSRFRAHAAKFLAAAAFVTWVSGAAAQPVLSTERILLSDEVIAANVVVKNSGTEAVTYKIGFQDVVQNPDGTYTVGAVRRDSKQLQSFLSVQPKEVTLGPGQTATVEVKGRYGWMQDGERRTHLRLMSGSDIVVSLPVIYRKGTLSASATILNAHTRRAGDVAIVAASVLRNGTRSLFGKMEVVGPDGEIIVQSNATSVFMELNALDLEVAIPAGRALLPGTVVRFRESATDGGAVTPDAPLALADVR